MKYFDFTQGDTIEQFLKLCRTESSRDDIAGHVATMIDAVRNEGDAAIIRFARQYDGIELCPDDFIIPIETIDSHRIALAQEDIDAINFAANRIKDYARRTLPQYDEVCVTNESYVTQKYVPYDRVACYVPCGSSPLVSTVLHTIIFAKEAGVKDVVMATSPKAGGVFPAMLYAAKVAGASSIITCGGVYGVAALAYGTQTIKPVNMIAGPGDRFVTEAKRQVFGKVAIDMIAGPSEVMVIADDTANLRYVAADLLAQAEHGSGFEQAVVVTTSDALYKNIEDEVRRQAKDYAGNKGLERVLEHGLFIIKVKDLKSAIQACNAYAPEHVEVQTLDAEQWAQGITTAGAIMIGNWTPEPIGDFVAGSSHVLPTGGAASSFSGLTTAHFLKKISIQKFDYKLLSECRTAAEGFAKMEQLPAHGRAVSIRFDD